MIIDVTSDDSGLYICSLMKNSSDSTESYQEHIHAYVRVRTRPGDIINMLNNFYDTLELWSKLQNFLLSIIYLLPGAVGSFRARATTIIAVLIWEVWRNRTGGSAIIDFTAEMRRLPGYYENNTEEVVKWERLDPHHM